MLAAGKQDERGRSRSPRTGVSVEPEFDETKYRRPEYETCRDEYDWRRERSLQRDTRPNANTTMARMARSITEFSAGAGYSGHLSRRLPWPARLGADNPL